MIYNNKNNIKTPHSCLTPSDVDECDNVRHSCEHICVNIVGTYNCECYVGYTLEDNRRVCKKCKYIAYLAKINCRYKYKMYFTLFYITILYISSVENC